MHRPEAVLCLVCWGNTEEASVAGAEEVRGGIAMGVGLMRCTRGARQAWMGSSHLQGCLGTQVPGREIFLTGARAGAGAGGAQALPGHGAPLSFLPLDLCGDWGIVPSPLPGDGTFRMDGGLELLPSHQGSEGPLTFGVFCMGEREVDLERPI